MKMSYEEDDSDNYEVTSRQVLRDSEYLIRMSVENGDLLTVEVEDVATTNQWAGKFDIAYIEELTHKTGNFKQFTVFCSMLESALNMTTESVSLDILTYSDLETLREQKVRGSQRRRPASQQSSQLNTKRYLILTYSVEFDRINYPLPLPYLGKADPAAMRETIQQLREEIKTLRLQLRSFTKGTDLEKLERDYEEVVRDKEALAKELASCQKNLKAIGKGTISKELGILKKVVQNLESDLMKERSKYQRMLAKKNQEYKSLADEHLKSKPGKETKENLINICASTGIE